MESLPKQMPEKLLLWYRKNARVLPWRENHDAYRVWISEIMLQQTRVEAVKEYYLRFLQAFPTVYDLASAPEEQVLKLWEGLGYYSRARNLQKTAKKIAEEHGGAFPQTAAELSKLPGIGEYTAGAISSIAFGNPEPAVDGNVLRVISRLAASRDNVALPAVKREITEKVREIFPSDAASDFTQALMELGALICLPNGEPLCTTCPLCGICKGYAEGIAAELPVKTAKKKRSLEEKTVFLLCCGERVALCKRAEKGLLAGMWEFPNCVGHLTEQEATAWTVQNGLTVERMARTENAKHIFTHIEWHMRGYFILVRKQNEKFHWADRAELEQELSVPSAFSAFLKYLYSEWDRR